MGTVTSSLADAEVVPAFGALLLGREVDEVNRAHEGEHLCNLTRFRLPADGIPERRNW